MLQKITIIICFSLFFKLNAQTTLAAGDIAIVGYNADEVSNEDEFSFVLLRDITAGTIIRFTDFGWCSDINGFQSANPCGGSTGALSDGALTWTASSVLTCGTQVRIVCGGLTLSASTGVVAGYQVVSNFPGEYMSFAVGGDQIFAFQGTLAAPTLITGLNMNGAWDASLAQCFFTSTQSTLPTALSAANSMALAPEVDNAIYNCTVTNDSPSNLRTAIFNSANWTTNDVTPFTLPLACSFGCSSCTTPTLNLSSQTNVSCNSGSNGLATMLASGGGPFTYAWSPSGGTSATATGLSAGVYTCVVTNSCSATASQTVSITQPTALNLTSASQTNISCNGGSNGAASVNAATGGAGAYTYNWIPGNPTGDGTVSVTGLTAGTWTCTVTDANSCTAQTTFNITAPTAISVTAASQTNVSCNGGSNGAASINTPTGGAGGYTYNWTPGNPTGDGTVSVTGLTAQVYTCTVTDANSCTAQTTFNITAPTAISVTAASQTNASCNGGSNGVASINTPTGGAGGFTYNWTPGNPTGDGTVSVTGLTAQVYTCTVTDANSCTATSTFNITAPTAISVTAASQTNISCFGGSNGVASINTPTGGAGGYTYNWTPGNPTGDETVSATGLTAGTWTCTVTDANSCTAQTTFTISQPTALAASSTATSISCNGGNSIVTVSANGGTINYSGTETYTVTAGTYTYTVTDANGCVANTNITITESSAIAGSQTLTLCAGQSVTVGSNTYNTSGVYIDVLTAANGCDSTVTTNLTVNPAITGSQTLTLCAGQSVTVGSNTYTTSGVYTDVLTAANGCDSTVTTNLTVNPAITGSQTLTLCAGQSVTVGTNTYNTSGVYTDVLTAVNGCDSTVTTNLTVNPAITGSQTLILCAGQTVTVGSNTYNGSGVYIDVLTAANGCDSTVTTNLTVNPAIIGSQTLTLCAGQFVTVGTNTYNTSGVYIDVLTAANGCDSTVTTSLTVSPAITNTQTFTLCAGQSITVGSNTYNTSGTYTDVLIAANGCDSTVTTNLTIENAIDLTTTISGETITANATGATYQWIDCDNGNVVISGETNQSFTAITNGNYAVIVTQNACSDTSTCVNISTVDINKLNKLAGFSLYPNPTNSSFTISGIETNSTINIYNAIGELVKSIQSTDNTTTIDLSDCSNSIYFIRIKNNKGEAIQKLIKQ